MVGSELGLKTVCCLRHLWRSHEGSIVDEDVKDIAFLEGLGGCESHALKRILPYLENSDMSKF